MFFTGLCIFDCVAPAFANIAVMPDCAMQCVSPINVRSATLNFLAIKGTYNIAYSLCENRRPSASPKVTQTLSTGGILVTFRIASTFSLPPVFAFTEQPRSTLQVVPEETCNGPCFLPVPSHCISAILFWSTERPDLCHYGSYACKLAFQCNFFYPLTNL